MTDPHSESQRTVRDMAASLRRDRPDLFADPSAPSAAPTSPTSTPAAREHLTAEPEVAPSSASLVDVIRDVDERRELDEAVRRKAEQRAADYGPIEEVERRIAAAGVTAATREVLDEAVAAIRRDVDSAREAGDRERVASGLASLSDVDKFLREHAAGRFPML